MIILVVRQLGGVGLVRYSREHVVDDMLRGIYSRPVQVIQYEHEEFEPNGLAQPIEAKAADISTLIAREIVRDSMVSEGRKLPRDTARFVEGCYAAI